ncbi:MAG: pyridoxamine 5'-phosphate oxidase family protein [Clostridiales bacterium]|nr:pyridoxamine 5'-phosphate oxidase family protein [Clostridiales bacterium]
MRRADREVSGIHEIMEILDEGKTCCLAMVDEGMPYVVPMSYAYRMEGETLILYFHSAKEGRKIRVLQKNPMVCFTIFTEGEAIFSQEKPCDSAYTFSSVVGSGNVGFIDSVQEKCAALSLLMKHQAGMEVNFSQSQAENVCVFQVVSKDFTGKRKTPPVI